MIVYWEYAFLENALLDGLLLYLAGTCARRRVCIWRLCLAAALGGAVAVVFPLIALPVWAAYFVKVVSGVLICLVACTGGAKACLIAVSAFFAFTFALGGILTAAYSARVRLLCFPCSWRDHQPFVHFIIHNDAIRLVLLQYKVRAGAGNTV